MAKQTLSLTGLLVTMLLATGCQPTKVQVSTLPLPNLNGPQFISAPPHHTGMIVEGPMKTNSQNPNTKTTALIPITGPADWIPHVHPRPWRWIVIHHSASPTGSAAVFDREHRAKGWDELGYHFVIGNGTKSGNGQIEVGSRWPKQKWGAHTKTPGNEYNDFGIGICLVGNFDVDHPTAAQMKSLLRLVTYLMKTYHITPDRIKGHKECKSTDCPGHNFNLPDFRRQAAHAMGGK